MRTLRRMSCLLAALLPITAAAVPVTYEFSGVLNRGYLQPLYGNSTFSFLPGTEFSGSFTIENSTPVSSSDSWAAYYDDLVTDFRVSIGAGGSVANLEKAAGGYSLGTIIDDLMFGGLVYQDSFRVEAAAAPHPGYANTDWVLSIGASTSVVGNLIPTGFSFQDPLPLDLFGVVGSWTFFASFTQYDDAGVELLSESVGGTLTSIARVNDPTPVPEPSAFWLSAALLPLALLRRKFPSRR